MNKLGLRPLERKQLRRRLTVEVPRFAPGGSPPPAGCWKPLLPERHYESDLPVYWRESLLRALVRNEQRFRLQHAADWVERCWFLQGMLARGPGGEIWGRVTRIVPARELRASAASFEFTPETWSGQIGQLEANGGVMLGWIHTHSLHFLARVGEEAAREVPAAVDERDDGPQEGKQLRSGLFLSLHDIHSASRRGFGAPYHLTCVLDSDACVNPEPVGLGRILGVWGWYEGRLCRRSLHVVKE
jgi:hypothetical protein